MLQKDDLEKKIWKKYENIKKDQEGRLEQIKQNMDESYKKAQLIEANISEVKAIIEVSNIVSL